MRAESIEQIREHLAKGGRVATSYAGEVVSVFGDRVCIRPCRGKNFYAPFTSHDFLLVPLAIEEQVKPEGWELLPIEEESLCDKCKCQSDSTQFCHKCKQVWLRLRGEAESEKAEDEPQIFRGYRFIIDGEDTGAGERIRTALLYGRRPEMSDLLEWWQAMTGERIEWGRRCNECECSGRINRRTVHEIDCPECKGSGYTVRPTWMEEQARDG